MPGPGGGLSLLRGSVSSPGAGPQGAPGQPRHKQPAGVSGRAGLGRGVPRCSGGTPGNVPSLALLAGRERSRGGT